ncbi:MAG: Gx transporter family protein [Oscillospiraceae bacterium]|nr:Gx transporter family protein [Oscillospiraceae bacterium]
MHTRAEKVAFCGVLTALAVILSYVETLVPINLGVPGIKPGFANIVAVFILFSYGFGAALTVNILRVVIIAAMFGSPASALYALSGAIVSLIVMALLRKTGRFSVTGVSMAGGVMHNAAQLAVAIAVTKTPLIVSYLPALIAAGMVTGIVIGIISQLLLRRVSGSLRHG